MNRVILGTAAVTDEAFLREAVKRYGDAIAVGVDIKDGYVAIKGWTEKSQYTIDVFIEKSIEDIHITILECHPTTDISEPVLL